MTEHIKWPKITSFHNVRKAVNKYPELCGTSLKISYIAKIKLHGTNSAIQISSKDNSVVAQSRSSKCRLWYVDKINTR